MKTQDLESNNQSQSKFVFWGFFYWGGGQKCNLGFACRVFDKTFTHTLSVIYFPIYQRTKTLP